MYIMQSMMLHSTILQRGSSLLDLLNWEYPENRRLCKSATSHTRQNHTPISAPSRLCEVQNTTTKSTYLVSPHRNIDSVSRQREQTCGPHGRIPAAPAALPQAHHDSRKSDWPCSRQSTFTRAC
jgi:hypothetical protein